MRTGYLQDTLHGPTNVLYCLKKMAKLKIMCWHSVFNIIISFNDIYDFFESAPFIPSRSW